MKLFVVSALSLFIFSFQAEAQNMVRIVVEGDDTDVAEAYIKAQGGDRQLNKYKKGRGYRGQGLTARVTALEFRDLMALNSENTIVEIDHVVSLPEFPGRPDQGAQPGNGNGKKPPKDNEEPVHPPQVASYGIPMIDADLAQAVTTGQNMVVCIVDTGIDASHDDLAGAVIAADSENFVFKKGRIDSAAWDDDHGHGTHCAGIAGARDNDIGVLGVAPDVSLLAMKVLDRRGSGYSSDVAQGIQACADNGADVISLSLGSSARSSVVEAAAIYALEAGALIVAAAGNDYGGSVIYPAALDGVIAVSAVDETGDLAVFSNVGPEIAFAAPGVDINSTYKGNDYRVWSGTSMATPFVAGVAALMLSVGNTELMAMDLGLPAIEQGAGLIDAWESVQSSGS